jgi:hypothetical protein
VSKESSQISSGIPPVSAFSISDSSTILSFLERPTQRRKFAKPRWKDSFQFAMVEDEVL